MTSISRCVLGAAASLAVFLAGPASAGPPYISDDPEPTDFGHYEIYAYTDGTNARGGTGGEAGIDFNYGAAPDLQLTAVMPLGYDAPADQSLSAGLGNIELAAKYRFLHQDDFGLDVSVFPRVFLPSGSDATGERHASFFLPIWAQKDWGKWSVFGGGGCTLNRAEQSENFCQVGGVLTRQVLSNLQLGAELVHQSATTVDGKATTSVGAGAIYDLSETYHLMAYAGPGIENAAENDRCSWYLAMQFTF